MPSRTIRQIKDAPLDSAIRASSSPDFLARSRMYAMSQRVSLEPASTCSSLLDTAFAHEDGCIEAEGNSYPCLAMERACDSVAICQLVKTQQHCLPYLAVETALLELTWLSFRIDLILGRTSESGRRLSERESPSFLIQKDLIIQRHPISTSSALS